MTGSQNTRGYERYFAIDTHREYHLVGRQNEDREWVVPPRRVSIEKFPEWAQKTFCAGDVVVLETTTNVCNTYDIVAYSEPQCQDHKMTKLRWKNRSSD